MEENQVSEQTEEETVAPTECENIEAAEEAVDESKSVEEAQSAEDAAEQPKKRRKIKIYPIIIGICGLAGQHGVYLLCHYISLLFGIPPFLPKINAIDDAFKIVPIFIIPYIWSYVYWAMAPMVASKCDKEHYKDYLAAYLFAVLFGGLILIFAPTYMNRVEEGLTSVSNKGFLYDLTRFWYSLDGGDMAYNLMPSFHCIVSTISYLGVARRKEIPLWFRIYSLIITLLIYLSTLFVKQHYFLDVITGIPIAIVAFVICKRFHAGRIFNRPINFFVKKFNERKKKKSGDK